MEAGEEFGQGVRRARRIAAISAIVAGLLFAVGSAIWAFEMPEGGASGAELVAFYDDNADRIIVGASLSLLAIAVFLLAASAFRRVLIDAEGDEVFATTAFAGAVLGVGAGLVAETVNMFGAIRAKDGELDDELARALFEVPQAMGSVATAVGFGVFALAAAWVAGRSGRVFPRYDVVLFTITGLVLLSPLAVLPEVPGAALVFLASIVGVQLLREPRQWFPARNEQSVTPTRSSPGASR
jgi:hypothetical protein